MQSLEQSATLRHGMPCPLADCPICRSRPIPTPQLIAPDEAAELGLADAPTLLGNQLERLFKAVGFPPCGGCERRRDWINAAHAWLRGDAVSGACAAG